MPSKKLIMIGSTVLVLVILVVVLVLHFKKDGYMYPSTTFTSVSPINGTSGAAVSSLAVGSQSLVSLVADTSGNLSTTANVPIGGIIMWAGSASAVPVNWALCDGTQGTPDLRSRFIVGASTDISVGQLGSSGMTSYPVGTTGGEEAHALQPPEMPSHTHDYAQDSSGPLANSTLIYGGATSNPGYKPTIPTGGDTNPNNVDANNVPLTVPHNNMPPFFALAFIMKIF